VKLERSQQLSRVASHRGDVAAEGLGQIIEGESDPASFPTSLPMSLNVLSVRGRNKQHCQQHQRKESHRFSGNQDIESCYSTQYLTAILARSSSKLQQAAESRVETLLRFMSE
jgi:hypothetical protein